MAETCTDGCPVEPTIARKRIHGTSLPVNERLGLRGTSPVECQFHVGDLVEFTNDYGVKFVSRVAGFADDDSFYGRFIHLDNDCWWFPQRPESLRLLEPATRDMTQDGYAFIQKTA